MKKLCIILLALVAVFSGNAQDTVNDSLWTVWESDEHDTARLHALHHFTRNTLLYENPDSAQALFELSIKTAENIKDKDVRERFQMRSKMQVAITHYIRGQLDDAVKFYAECLNYYSVTPGFEGSAAAALINLGNIHMLQEDYASAENYYKEALTLSLESGHIERKSIAYHMLGSAQIKLKKFDEGLVSLDSALNIRLKQNKPSKIVSTLNNIATAYFDQDLYEKALKAYNDVINYPTDVNVDRQLMNAYSNAARCYLKLNQPRTGLPYAIKGLELSKSHGAMNDQEAGSEILYSLYWSLDMYKEAFETYRYNISIKDSISKESNQRAIIKEQYRYDYFKDSLDLAKEKELSELKLSEEKARREREKIAHEKELVEEQNQKYLLYGGIAILVILGGGIFLGYNNKKKANAIISQQKLEVENQRDLANEQRALVEEKNKEITDSIKYSKRLQEAILPQEELVKELLPNSFILYKPKDIVAGDFYWMSAVGEKSDKVLFAAADCTGHGVPGAMVSVVCANALNRATREFGLTAPGEILDKTTELVINSFNAKSLKGSHGKDIRDGMDIALCLMDYSTNKLHYAGANNALYHVCKNADEDQRFRDQKGEYALLEYKADRQPIGKYFDHKPFTTHQVQLEKGDSIYVFTDGYADQFGGPRTKKYKYANFKHFLLNNHTKGLVEQKQLLDEEFISWKGDIEQIDDVCVIGLRV